MHLAASSADGHGCILKKRLAISGISVILKPSAADPSGLHAAGLKNIGIPCLKGMKGV